MPGTGELRQGYRLLTILLAEQGCLTGGTFGPEASVLALVLICTATAAALALARRTGRFDIR